jgi:hypothetical protein
MSWTQEEADAFDLMVKEARANDPMNGLIETLKEYEKDVGKSMPPLGAWICNPGQMNRNTGKRQSYEGWQKNQKMYDEWSIENGRASYENRKTFKQWRIDNGGA